MKTRTKVSGQYQLRYASGILMYRERKNLLEVPANATVNILRVEVKRTLCTYKGDRVFIPNENLPKRKAEATPKARKVKAEVAVEATQAAQTPAETPVATVEVNAEVPAPAPVVETTPEPAVATV